MGKIQYIKGYEMNKFHKQILEIYHSLNLPEHFNNTGNKQFTNFQRFAIILLFVRSRRSLRLFCEEFKETKWSHYLKLEYEITKSSLSRWINLFNLNQIEKALNETTKNIKPKISAIDGTGIDSTHKSSYYKKRIRECTGRYPKQKYHKTNIIIDVFSGMILNFKIYLRDRNDSFIGKKLVKKYKHKNTLILADKGYPDFDFEDMVGKTNHFISPPKKNEGGKHNRLKSLKKKRLFNDYSHLYSLRNNVESENSSLKRVEGLKLRCRKHTKKRVEFGIMILLHNIRRNISFLLFLFYFLNFKKFKNY